MKKILNLFKSKDVTNVQSIPREAKVIKMNRAMYNMLRGWEVPKNENPQDDGYAILYTKKELSTLSDSEIGDNIKWMPTDVFNNSFNVLGNNGKEYITVIDICDEILVKKCNWNITAFFTDYPIEYRFVIDNFITKQNYIKEFINYFNSKLGFFDSDILKNIILYGVKEPKESIGEPLFHLYLVKAIIMLEIYGSDEREKFKINRNNSNFSYLISKGLSENKYDDYTKSINYILNTENYEPLMKSTIQN